MTIEEERDMWKKRAERLAAALRKISDKQNWGYFDNSGCPKGAGEYTEAWQGDVHAIEIAKAALAEFGEGE